MNCSMELNNFIKDVEWTYAITMPEWPHEYIVRENVNEVLFVKMVEHIRRNGYGGKFYNKSLTYYDEGEMVYWTMGEPIEDTVIINRCRKNDTYEYRLLKGVLP